MCLCSYCPRIGARLHKLELVCIPYAAIAHVSGLRVCFLTHWRILDAWENPCDLFNTLSLELGNSWSLFSADVGTPEPKRAEGGEVRALQGQSSGSAVTHRQQHLPQTATEAESFRRTGNRATKSESWWCWSVWSKRAAWSQSLTSNA